MDPRDIRRWAENQRIGEQRAIASSPRLTPQEAFAFAMELLVFDEQMNGDPFDRFDPVSEREDEEARQAWHKLRARWRRGR